MKIATKTAMQTAMTNAKTAPLKRRFAILVPALLPLLLALFIGLTHVSARAAPKRKAEEIAKIGKLRVTGLKRMAGKYLHLFYVSAQSKYLGGARGQQLDLKGVLGYTDRIGDSRLVIPEEGVIEVPLVKKFPRFKPGGVPLAFSYLYIAIADSQPDPLYLWKLDGTPVPDFRLPNYDDLRKLPASSFKALSTGYISKDKLFALPATSDGTTLLVDMAKDVSN